MEKQLEMNDEVGIISCGRRYNARRLNHSPDRYYVNVELQPVALKMARGARSKRLTATGICWKSPRNGKASSMGTFRGSRVSQ
jgi:hypothetical protein